MNNTKLMITFIALVLFAIPLATAQLIVPHQFYGDVTINEQPAPNNLIIEARVGGQLISSTTTSNGRYGYNPNIFYVDYQGSDGATITFFIEGEQVATRTFQSGQSTRLDFVAEIEGINTGNTGNTGSTGGGSSGGASSSGGSSSGGSSGGAIGSSSTSESGSTGGVSIEINGTDCTPNWVCTEWNTCVNNLQSRTCVDRNECGDDTLKPIERQSCEQTTEELFTTTQQQDRSERNMFTGFVTGIGEGDLSSFGVLGFLILIIGLIAFFTYRKVK